MLDYRCLTVYSFLPSPIWGPPAHTPTPTSKINDCICIIIFLSHCLICITIHHMHHNISIHIRATRILNIISWNQPYHPTTCQIVPAQWVVIIILFTFMALSIPIRSSIMQLWTFTTATLSASAIAASINAQAIISNKATRVLGGLRARTTMVMDGKQHHNFSIHIGKRTL